jgi:hypothetical protein
LSVFFTISEEEIDGNALVGLSEDDLTHLFEKRGPRAKFRVLLEQLKVCALHHAPYLLSKAGNNGKYAHELRIHVLIVLIIEFVDG